MSYRSISNFGSGVGNSPIYNPLLYILSDDLNNKFTYGAITGNISNANSELSQEYIAQYCAANTNEWDKGGVCYNLSYNKSKRHPNLIGKYTQLGCCKQLTEGEILIKNTASRKYLSNMYGNCNIRYEQFDLTVASSPMVALYPTHQHCIFEYEVNPDEIDNDPVMNKILNKPSIALDILINIYNTAKRKNILKNLKDTKLYKFFMSKEFQAFVVNIKRIPVRCLC